MAKKLTEKSQTSARKRLVEELFYDFNRSRAQVYMINFVRGIFFGLGSVLGGTLVVAILVWAMSFFVDLPAIGDSIESIQQTIESNPSL